MSQRNTAARMELHMRRYDASGLTAVAYCAKHKISLATFYYWRKKLSSSSSDSPLQSKEIRMEVKDPADILVQLPQGVSIRFSGPVSACYLRELAGLVVID